ncbi:hypothetical protein P43SY_009873 [Pythium insidiosum]|uniref:Uncharacterized protein n=1 Tax=Pythium insidiosum TaxID=114742 RepID=A0AAD5QAR8_PYTIN|nr:hypothetical protein P43SY_009873 [Pythium insidiosum]
MDGDASNHQPPEDEQAQAAAVEAARQAATLFLLLAAAHDVDDLVRELVDDLVDDTSAVAATSVVTSRLVPYVAGRLATQLVDAVAPCLVSRSDALDELPVPSLSTSEEPTAPPPLDVSSRHAIASLSPSLSPRAASAPAAKGVKRVIRLGAFAARSLLSATTAPTSPSRPSSVSSSFRGRAGKRQQQQQQQQSRDPSKPVPGVPFSVEPSESPRKGDTPLRPAQDDPQRQGAGETRQDDGADDSEPWRSASIDDALSPRQSPLASGRSTRATTRRLQTNAPSLPSASASPASSSSGRAAWSLTLPVRSPEPSEHLGPSPDAVAIEFHVPRRSSLGVLPDVSRAAGPQRRGSVAASAPPPPRGARLLPLVDESEAVAVDEIAMLGVELHASLTLAPGVTQQTMSGLVLQSGPELPEDRTHMRRATFLVSPAAQPEGRVHSRLSVSQDGGVLSTQAHEQQESPPIPQLSRPPAPEERRASEPAETAPMLSRIEADDAADRVFLTQLKGAEIRAESAPMRPFRAPSKKIARPCTSSSGCRCADHATSVSVNPHDAFGEVVKQRAFQRKPSSAAASPTRRVANWQAQLHSDAEPLDAGARRRATTSPLARRTLHPPRR